jgi:hypothetical protein
MRDWRDSIEQLVNNHDLPGKRLFHFVMPRQVGVTTFLINLAERQPRKGILCGLIVTSMDQLADVRRRTNVSVFLSSTTALAQVPAARHYDLWLADGLIFARERDRVLDKLWELLTPDGRILWMDTVEDGTRLVTPENVSRRCEWTYFKAPPEAFSTEPQGEWRTSCGQTLAKALPIDALTYCGFCGKELAR